MNEELENMLNSDASQNQNGENVGIESESSIVGIIFAVLAWLNLVVGLLLMITEKDKTFSSDRDYTLGFTLLGSSLFLFAVASCLKFLAKISSRLGRIMGALEK